MNNILLIKDIDKIITSCKSVILDSKRNIGGKCGWHQYLGSKKIGIPATSMAILILKKLDTNNYDIDDNLNYIANSELYDNGWGYVTNINEISNVDATCWALKSLNIQKEKYSDIINKGIEWLIKSIAQNAIEDIGWGFFKNNESRIYTTCIVLRTLKELNYNNIEEFESGINWLINIQNDDCGWGEKKGSSSSIFHTSYAITTLIECQIQDINIINTAIKWLDKAINDKGLNNPLLICSLEFIDETTENGDKKRIPIFHFTVPHVIQAFVKSNNSKNKLVFNCLKILYENNQGGYWLNPLINNNKIRPIWAIYDSIDALLDIKHSIKKWDKTHHLMLFFGRMTNINKKNPIRLWNILPDYLSSTIIASIILFIIIYSIIIIVYYFKLYDIIKPDPNIVSISCSIIAAIIYAIICRIIKYIWKKIIS